jgi:hypothetical protein
MKTRVNDGASLFLSLVFCLSISACNKEDYYQKEFLDNPYQEEPQIDGPVDNGDQDGDGTDSSDQGGAQSGTAGGITGGATTGSTTGGGVAGGTDGSTTGGTDGSVSGGASGSTSGGSVGGATAGGSTTGGTDGSVTGGTSGSSTAGSTNGATAGGATPVSTEEVFRQNATQTKKLDIVWVIDNSGSMADEQNNLGVNFNSFIQEFITKDVDFKMAITTTDTRAQYKGLMVTNSDTRLTSAQARSNPTRFMNDFKNMVKVGTSGSGNEKGLEATEGFMGRYSSSFVRPDAYLAVVIVSDEEDSSSKTPTQYMDYLKSFKQEGGLVKVYSIVDVNRLNIGRGLTTGFQRYADASNLTAGTVSDIYDDFSRSLTAMGDSIIELLDSFALAHEPVNGSLRVLVNGGEVSDYIYDATSRSISFNSNAVPAVGAEIKVQYLR